MMESALELMHLCKPQLVLVAVLNMATNKEYHIVQPALGMRGIKSKMVEAEEYLVSLVVRWTGPTNPSFTEFETSKEPRG